ncbi:hypothetical protein [Streptomyces sp. NPDC001635]
MSARDTLIGIVRQWTERNDGALATPEAVVDAFREEVLAANGSAAENYPGELAMLRGLLGVVRVIAKHGDVDELRRVVQEYESDEQGAFAEAEEKSSREAVATPDFFQPGHTYSSTIYGGPLTVHHVGTHPATGEPYAQGWVHYDDDTWAPHIVTGLFDRFTDVTEGGATDE